MGKKPIDVIKDKSIDAKSSTSYSTPVGLKEKRLDSSMNVRYLYTPGELKVIREERLIQYGQWRFTI